MLNRKLQGKTHGATPSAGTLVSAMVRPKIRARAVWKEEEFYVVEITAWDWSFSFGISNARHRFPEVYSDHRHLIINGTVIRPKKEKVESAQFTFIPRDGYNPEILRNEKFEREPTSLAEVHESKGKLRGVFAIPSDVLGPLLTTLAAERIKYVTLSGAALHAGNATIGHFSFHQSYSPDDLPPERKAKRKQRQG